MRNEEALCRSQSSQDELLAVARALKKQFADNRKDSSDPAQTTAGEESGSHYSQAAEIYGELRVAGKKGKDEVGHSVALKAYPEYAHLADAFSAADPVFVPSRAVHSVRP